LNLAALFCPAREDSGRQDSVSGVDFVALPIIDCWGRAAHGSAVERGRDGILRGKAFSFGIFCGPAASLKNP